MPSTITANNASGALTLRFTSDGSVTYSGFTAVASCVLPQGLEVKTAIWTNQIDNNYNGYTQSRMLNYTIKNNTSAKSVVYAKIYRKTVDAVTYFLYGQTPNVSVNANSTSETLLYNISELPVQAIYDFKIELYDSSNALITTADQTTFAILGAQRFEPARVDGAGTYCTSNLGGGGSDITAVSVTGTTLNNTLARTTSSYISYGASGVYTGTLTLGIINTINVTTTNNDIISMWIDYDHNSTFDAGEWTLISAASGAKAVSASFFIPTTAILGQTRMRIRTRSAGTANFSTDACTNFSSGSTEDYIITIDKYAGINTALETQFKLYPNPANSIINIDIPEFVSGTINVLNALGQTVQIEKVSGSHFTHNISGLNPGLYFIKITSDNGKSYNRQLIVK